MVYEVVYTKEAATQIKKLDKPIQKRIKESIERIAQYPELGKFLTGPLSNLQSYRVGDYRIIYRTQRKELIILIFTVGHRKEVYRIAS